MPIYAYKCGSCGHAKDVLQKISEPALTVCPECGAGQFAKQITAAGFQLKGSGWYATDFRSNGAAKPADKAAEKPADGGKTDSTPAPVKPDTPAAAAPGGCGGSCACH